MSGKLRFRFDAAKAEPLLRELAQRNEPQDIQDTLAKGLERWPGVALCRVWPPGTPHVPFGSARLGAVSAEGASLHVPDRLLDSKLLAGLKNRPRWIEEGKIRGLGAHPWGDTPPHGVLLVFTRVPLTDEAFAWLERIAAHAGIAWSRATTGDSRILTAQELRALERDNLVRALKQAGGKVFGPGGAAALLGMKPTTLASRIKALGIPKSDARRSEKSAKPLSAHTYPESR